MEQYYNMDYYINYTYLISQVCRNIEVDGGQNMSVDNRTRVYMEECDNLTNLLDFYDYSSLSNKAEKFYMPIVFGIVLIIGLIGNGLVVYVILKSASLKCVTNLYLLNLAMADLLFLSVCVPFTGIFVVLPSWPFGEAMCKIVYYLMIVTAATTVWTMTAMTIDRYFAVVKPLRSKSIRTPQRTIITLALVWIINSTILIPLLQVYEIRSFPLNGYSHNYCVEIFGTEAKRRAYYLSIAFAFYLIPLGVIALAYCLMARKLWAGVSPAFKKVNRAKALRYRKKVAKMMLVVVIMFAVCWFPIHAYHIKNEIFSPGSLPTETLLKTLALSMAYMNSAMNPIIYAFMNANFRQSFRAAFSCRKIQFHMIFLIQDLEAIQISNKDGKKPGLPDKTGKESTLEGSSSATSAPTHLMSTYLTSNSTPDLQNPTTNKTEALNESNAEHRVLTCSLDTVRSRELCELEADEEDNDESDENVAVRVALSTDGVIKSAVAYHRHSV